MLLDVFTILFESDTSALDKGIDSSRQSADHLVDSLKKVDKQSEKTGSSYAGFAAKAVGFLGAALSLSQIISGTIGKAADIAAIYQTAETFRIAVEDLDAFGRAASTAGGSAQGARDAVIDMAKSIGAAMSDADSSQAKTFGNLGISLRGVNGQAINGLEGILKLSDAVQGLGREQAIYQIKQAGIKDDRTAEIILKGRKEIEKMMAEQKKQGVITKEAAEQAKKFTDGMDRMKGVVDSAGKSFTMSIIPGLTKAIEWIEKFIAWAGAHSDFIVGFFTAIAAIITAIYLPAMYKAAAATLVATWPIIAIGVAIAAVAAAFALAYDDIMNFVDGNDSFIGQMFDKYPAIKEIVYLIIDAFKLMGEVVVGIFDTIMYDITAMVEFIKSAFAGISKIVGMGANFVASIVGGDGQNATMDVASGIVSGKQQMATAAQSPLNSVTSGAISNSVSSASKENNLHIENISINAPNAKNSGDISKNIGGDLNRQLSQMDAEFATGVDR